MQRIGTSGHKGGNFAARFESLEERQCLSVNVTSIETEDGTRLKIEGDAKDNVIEVVSHGDGSVSVKNGAGKLLAAVDDVSVIRASLKGGADAFTYRLEDTLVRDQSIFLELGAGADQASFDLAAGVSEANLKIEVDGGAGADTISSTIGSLAAAQVAFFANGGDGADNIAVDGTGATISADSRLRAKLFGEAGKDTLTATFDGKIDGILNIQNDGGKGVDKVVTSITAAAESIGTLRTKASGRGGVDEVALSVVDNSGEEGSLLAELKAKLIDRPGTDLVSYTANVEFITGPAEPEAPELVG
jgi:hypothetical protein